MEISSADFKTQARKLMPDAAPGLFYAAVLYLLIMTLFIHLLYILPGSIDYRNMNDLLAMGESFRPAMIYKDFRPAGFAAALLLFLFKAIPDAGMMNCCMKSYHKYKEDGCSFLFGLRYFSKVIKICIITTIFTLMWSLLLIIPGIMAAYRYRLAYYILIDDPAKSALQCISESIIMMTGNKVDLFTIDVSFLVWYFFDWVIAVSLLFFTPLFFILRILLIWIAPYRGLTNVCFYMYCKNKLAV